MKLSTLTLVTRWVICLGAVALAIGALKYNRAHLVTAAFLFVVGLNVKWTRKEDRL